MNPTRIRTVARRLAVAPPDREEKSVADGDLLTRFLDAHDETAFEALVARHLPAVRAVCRSVLRDANDADDAAQATFLVLVRRASVVRNRQALGAWLCRVAWRTANRLRSMNITRAGRQVAGFDPDATPGRVQLDATDSDEVTAMHEEVARLPEPYRLAVLTCYAAGTPTAEAAARLGWPKGTLLTRLAWARRRLRDRLTRRGITLAGGMMSLFAVHTGRATGFALAGRITAAAVAIASGDAAAARELVPDRVSTLTEGMVRAMIGTKIKIALAIAFVTVALLGLGLGRMSAGAADAADKKLAPIVAAPPTRIELAKPATLDLDLPKTDLAPAVPAGPGTDLVVRRPLGSFTREVAPFGKGTITFAENRLHIHATVNIEKFAMTVALDADYSVNRESVVYGIITAADITAPGEAAIGVAPLAAVANDLPFSFRVRVEDDSISIKDLKVGPIGSPLFMEAFGKGDGKDMQIIAAMLGGKYKADAERVPPTTVLRKK